MPIHYMLYRCPRCGHDPLVGHEGGARCSSCGTQFEQGRGAAIIVRPPEGPVEQSSASRLIQAVEEMGGPGTKEGLSREARAAFGRAEGHDVIRWRGEVLGFSEKISRKGDGLIRLEGEVLTFRPDGGRGGLSGSKGRDERSGRDEEFSCHLSDIRGVQISSMALQVTLKGQRLYQFTFLDDSPKRWEDLLCLALRRFYDRSGQCITEFRPRIVITRDRSPARDP